MFVTLDSSVIIAALRKQEDKHIQCQLLLERIKDAQISLSVVSIGNIEEFS